MNKILKWAIRGTTFVLVAGATLVGAYMVIPARTKVITYDGPGGGGQGDTQTYFSQFVNNLTAAAEGEAEKPLGLSAEFNDLEITFPGKEANVVNDIKIEGDLNLLMNGISNLNFTLDVDANYNGKNVSLLLGLVHDDFYIALQDLRIKSPVMSTLDIFDYVNDLFFNPDNPDGLGIDLNVSEFVAGLVGGLDINSLLGGVSLPTINETVNNNLVTMNLVMEDMGLDIDIVIDKDTLAIVTVDLKTIQINDIVIKGKLDFEVIDKVIAPDEANYPHQRGTFIDSISYVGWVDRLLNLFKERKLGLEFNADLSLAGKDLAHLNTSINFDFSDILNFYTLSLDGRKEKYASNNNNQQPVNQLRPARLEAPEEELPPITVDDFKDVIDTNGKLKFDITADARGQKNESYMNFALSYFDTPSLPSAGYLTFNQTSESNAVMKAKMSNATVSSVINKLPGLIALATPVEQANDIKQVEEASEGLFDFITDSKLIKAITKGDYSEIISF